MKLIIKKKLVYSVLYILICIICWLWLEKDAIHMENELSKLMYLIGCWRGYRMPLVTVLVFISLHVVLIGMDNILYSTDFSIRMERERVFKKNSKRVVCSSIVHSTIYVGVHLIFVTYILGIRQLVEIDYFYLIIIYYLSVLNVFILAGMSFTILKVIIKKKVASVVLTAILNVLISYVCDNCWLYGNLGIIDIALSVDGLNIIQWIFSQLSGICIACLIAYIAKEMYTKVDIV